MLPDPVIETARLRLLPCTPADSDDFIALEQDAEVMHFLNGGPVDHAAIDPDHAGFLMPRGTETYVWTGRQRSDGAFVGWFCLYPETPLRAELGYRLARNGWGKGYATEGAAALVRWGFESCGYADVVACTMAVNRGSRRVMEKIGMRHVRTDFPTFAIPLPGAEEGEVWYQMLRPDPQQE